MDDYRDAYGDASEPLGAVAPGGSTTGNLEVGNDRDYFAITLVAGRTYTFDLYGVAGGGGTLNDPYLELYSGSGGYLAGNSSANFNTNDAQIVFTARASGTYYLAALGQYSTELGTYRLSASSGYVDDYRDTYNDAIEALGSVAPGGSTTGVIEMSNDRDVFAITLVAGRTYTFDLQGAAGGGTLSDAYLELYSGAGGYLAGNSNANFSTTDSRIMYTATVSGTFYLSALGENSNVTGSYRLSASSGYVDDYRDTYNDGLEALGSVTPGGSATGNLEVGNDRDYFAINLVAGRTYTFDLKGAPGGGGTLGDAYLELYSATGGYLAGNSNASGATTDARIVFTATASATYYLSALGQTSADVGTYRISASSGFGDDYRDVYNDGLETLGALTAGGATTGDIEIDGDRDVFAVTLVSGRTYTFDLKGAPGGGGTLADAYLELYSATGGYLAGNSNASGSTTDARITYTATANATYYLYAQSQNTPGVGTYRLSASSGYVDDYRDIYTDGSEALGTLTVGAATTGSIEAGGDRDVFAVTLQAGRTYAIDLRGAPSGNGTLSDTYVELYGATGGYLAGNSSAATGTTDARILYTAASGGVHYIYAGGQTTALTGTYTLSAVDASVDDYRDTVGETTAPLGVVTLGGTSKGAIESAGDIDVFAVTLTAGQTYTFDLTTAGGATGLANAELRLLNGAGTVLRLNDDFNGANARIVYTAAASGTHYLDARSHTSTTTGLYTLTARAGFDDLRDSITDGTAALGVLTIGGSQLGVIEVGGDIDILRVTLVAGRTYTFDLTGSTAAGPALANGELRLLNGAGTVLRLNDDYNSTDARLIYTAVSSGDHYIDVRSHTTTTSGGYAVSVRENFDDARDSLTDTTAALTTLVFNTPVVGAIETAGDVDLFKVTLVAGQTYTFELSGSATGATLLANPELRLLNSAGTLLRLNDDFNGVSSRIIFTATSSGTYYLDARSHVATATGGYSIIARSGFDDVRDTITDATAPLGVLTLGVARLGAIEVAGDYDVFQVQLTAGQSYTFDLAGSSTGGTALPNGELRLMNAGGTVLRVNDDFNGVNSRIVFTATSTGSYYLDVRSHTTLTTSGVYTLKATAGFDDGRDSITDTTAVLGRLTLGTPLQGVIETAGDRDVFAITLTAGQSYTFDLTGSSAAASTLLNGELRLLTSAGAVLQVNDDFNSLNARIVFTATATGTYYLEARSHTTTTTGGYAIVGRAGFDDLRDSIAETTATIGLLSVGAPRLGTIETVGDVDVFRVSLTAGQSYLFDLTGAANGGAALANGELRLLTGRGAVLGYSNDANGGLDPQIAFTAAATGVYYLEARGHRAATGVYSLSATVVTDDFADARDDDANPLGALALGQTRSGVIERAGDVDMFAFTLTDGAPVTLSLRGATTGALSSGDILVFDAAGAIVAYAVEDGATLDLRLAFDPTAAGTYYLSVAGDGDASGSYVVGLEQAAAGLSQSDGLVF